MLVQQTTTPWKGFDESISSSIVCVDVRDLDIDRPAWSKGHCHVEAEASGHTIENSQSTKTKAQYSYDPCIRVLPMAPMPPMMMFGIVCIVPEYVGTG